MALIRFPQERVDYDTVRMDWGLPATILILPVVRIEGEPYDDSPPEEPGRRGRRRR